MPSVGEAFHLAEERPGSGGHPLELHRGDDIRMLAVGKFGQRFFINPAEARRQHQRADMQLKLLRLLAEVNSVALADWHADLTGAVLHMQTGCWVNVIGGRHGLRVINVDGAGQGQPFVVVINQVFRAVLSAQPAGRAFGRLNVTGPLPHFNRETAWCSVQCQQIGIGDHLDIRRPTGLHQFWRENSERAVVSRKSFVQLRHHPADHRGFVEQINVISQLSQVKGSLYAGNAAADHHH